MATPPRQEEAPHLWLKDIRENQRVRGRYLVKDKRMGTTRRGDPFLIITLADRTGAVAAKVWEGADKLSSLFAEGDVVKVDGLAGAYRGQMEITLSGLEAVKGDVDPGLFLESAPREISEMMASLRETLEGVKNVHLKALSRRFLGDQALMARFKRAPAAKNFHHSYVGGLLEHTLSVCQMAVRVTDHYPRLDRDLLLTAAFLHDIGKTQELTMDSNIAYTDEGRLIGHVVLGAEMVDRKLGELKAFPQELALRLKHLILSHHGQYEFGSPKRPKFLEAFALHLIDDLDAKINGLSRFFGQDRQEGPWTDFNRLFERYLLKGELFPGEQAAEPGADPDDPQGSLFSS